MRLVKVMGAGTSQLHALCLHQTSRARSFNKLNCLSYVFSCFSIESAIQAIAGNSAMTLQFCVESISLSHII
jgi:hypothetical protein